MTVNTDQFANVTRHATPLWVRPHRALGTVAERTHGYTLTPCRHRYNDNTLVYAAAPPELACTAPRTWACRLQTSINNYTWIDACLPPPANSTLPRVHQKYIATSIKDSTLSFAIEERCVGGPTTIRITNLPSITGSLDESQLNLTLQLDADTSYSLYSFAPRVYTYATAPAFTTFTLHPDFSEPLYWPLIWHIQC